MSAWDERPSPREISDLPHGRRYHLNAKRELPLPSEEFLTLLGECHFRYASLLDGAIAGVAMLATDVRFGEVTTLSREKFNAAAHEEFYTLLHKNVFNRDASGGRLKKGLNGLKNRLGRDDSLDCDRVAVFEEYVSFVIHLLGLGDAEQGLTASRNLIAHAAPIFGPYAGTELFRQYVDERELSKDYHVRVPYRRILDKAFLEGHRDDLATASARLQSCQESISVTHEGWLGHGGNMTRLRTDHSLWYTLFPNRMDDQEISERYEAFVAGRGDLPS